MIKLVGTIKGAVRVLDDRMKVERLSGRRALDDCFPDKLNLEAGGRRLRSRFHFLPESALIDNSIWKSRKCRQGALIGFILFNKTENVINILFVHCYEHGIRRKSADGNARRLAKKELEHRVELAHILRLSIRACD